MAKTETIRARVEPELKQKADKALAELGVTATDAITRMYEEVVSTGALPFADDATTTANPNKEIANPKEPVEGQTVVATSQRPPAEASRFEGYHDTVSGEQQRQGTPKNDIPKEELPTSSSREGTVSLGGFLPDARIKPATIFIILGSLAFAALFAVFLYLLVAERSHTHDEYAEHTHAHYEYASHTHAHDEYAEHTHAEYAEHTHTHDEYAEHTHVVSPYGYGLNSQPQYPVPPVYETVPAPAPFWPAPELYSQPSSGAEMYYCSNGEYYSFQASPDCVYRGTYYNRPFG